jgi:hypothetical protein
LEREQELAFATAQCVDASIEYSTQILARHLRLSAAVLQSATPIAQADEGPKKAPGDIIKYTKEFLLAFMDVRI